MYPPNDETTSFHWFHKAPAQISIKNLIKIATTIRTEAAFRTIVFIASQGYGENMKRAIWINKSNSFDEAQEFDTAYYLNLSTFLPAR